MSRVLCSVLKRVLALAVSQQPPPFNSSYYAVSSQKALRGILSSASRRWIETTASASGEAVEAANNTVKTTRATRDSYSYLAAEPSATKKETNDETSVVYNAVSSLKVSERHDLAMIYTCRVCETRSVKTVCHESYENGVALVCCSGCNNLHLIADRLGWFGEPGSVEVFLAARGESVKRGSSETMELMVEDLAGRSKKDL